ncbi:thyroid peroxidase [Kryptolebias marmoratus]|uniref:Thyroid peroxidase n=1 Tax=Kryptolebias marmoratus TaxID=37003 RepID=A0A3Q2ZY63_KRYMA|nr:thyroid peroxidase [Kryptolebias marmoratus]
MTNFSLFLLITSVCVVQPRFSADEASTFNSSTIRELLISSFEESLQFIENSSDHYRQRRSTSRAEPDAQGVSRAGEVFHAALQLLKDKAKQKYKRNFTASALLSEENVELLAELSLCPAATDPDLCEQSRHNKYRTPTGVCNNRRNPRWGAANTALVRWLPAEYEDGEGEPKGWNRERLHNGFQLPPPRSVSREIIRSTCKWREDDYSQLLVDWGQYIDHDITFTPQSVRRAAFWTDVDCHKTCKNVHPCFPIETEDSLCMPFRRSTPDCFVTSGSDFHRVLQRQQQNSITSYIDASLVYGHTLQLEGTFRDLSGLSGKLAINDRFKDPNGRSFLPFVAKTLSACHTDQQGERVECFSAGDSRVNEVLTLIALHTLWLREHNRIAEALRLINDHWSPEIIYQEARKIVGALHQIITIRDYVPKIIGLESFEHHIGPYRGYDPTVDASASNVFATAAFRFGHGTIPPILSRLNTSFQEHEQYPHLRIHKSFFSPWRIVKEGGIEPTLRGMIGTAAPTVRANSLLAEEVTEMLLVLDTHQNMDLASLNLQRGRDHGLPGYNKWRNFCGLTQIKTLDDLMEAVGDGRVAEKILNLYKHPDNIDVWLGGLVENFLPGSRTGPLFACLIGKQIKSIRDGDRFWWEADGVFTKQQKNELLKASLSRVICDNSDIQEIPPEPFRFGKYPSDYVDCSEIPSMSLEAWREEKSQDLQLCGLPRPIKNGDFIFSSQSGKLTALYSCYHGFKLEGAAEIVCEGNQWNNEAPRCTCE